MGSAEHYSNYARRHIVVCNSSAERTLLGSYYAPTAEKCYMYNPISFSHKIKPKTEFQYNAATIQIIAKCSRYCRLLLAN